MKITFVSRYTNLHFILIYFENKSVKTFLNMRI